MACANDGDGDHPSLRMGALSLPAPGQQIVLDFKKDALGNPLTRGTVLAEQFAAWGIHFGGGFVLGDRAVDFAGYTGKVAGPAPDVLICASDVDMQGVCTGGPPPNTALDMKLDFPACRVKITGYSVVTEVILGGITTTGFDGEGVQKGVGISGYIQSSWNVVGGNRILVSEGSGESGIPNNNSSASPSMGELVLAVPEQGLDLRRIRFAHSRIGAMDDIVITACNAVIPRCKDRQICLEPTDPCLSAADVSIDDGSYAWTGGSVSLADTTAGDQTSRLAVKKTLSITQGADTETCSATVSAGDCVTPPLITCPPPVSVECAPDVCVPIDGRATASDRCGSWDVKPDPGQSCLRLGTAQLTFTAFNAGGLKSTCTSSITVGDHTPPHRKPGVSGFINLAPDDGTKHLVSVTSCLAYDDCLQSVWPVVTCVTSDEPLQDGDVVIADDWDVWLRASRDPQRPGRLYEIQVDVTDPSGNVLHDVCKVSVTSSPTEAPLTGGAAITTVCPRPMPPDSAGTCCGVWPNGGPTGGAGGASPAGGGTGSGAGGGAGGIAEGGVGVAWGGVGGSAGVQDAGRGGGAPNGSGANGGAATGGAASGGAANVGEVGGAAAGDGSRAGADGTARGGANPGSGGPSAAGDSGTERPGGARGDGGRGGALAQKDAGAPSTDARTSDAGRLPPGGTGGAEGAVGGKGPPDNGCSLQPQPGRPAWAIILVTAAAALNRRRKRVTADERRER